VDSAIVRLVPWPHPPHPAKDFTLFEKMVRQLFSLRRKAIRNGVKYWLTHEQICNAGIDPGCRPDNLSVADLVTLANTASDAATNATNPSANQTTGQHVASKAGGIDP
jgi:16S rRNA (adenine1518-N6/adenine1519-N6)-dimethyltransferase